METIIRVILSFLIILLPTTSLAQIDRQNIKSQRLRLNLSWGYLYVVGQNQISRDSAMALSSRQTNTDKLILITQDDEILFSGSNVFVTSRDEIQFLKLQLSKYTGKEYTRLLNSIGWMYVFEQGDLKNSLDSASLFLNRAKIQSLKQEDDEGLSDNLCYLGLYYYKKGELRLGDSCIQEAITRYKRTGNKKKQAIALGYEGVYFPFGQCSFQERIDCLKKSLELYNQLNDKESQAITLLNAGYLSFADNQLEESKQLVSASLQLQRSIGFPYTHFTTDMLSLIGVVEGNNADYLKYALESVRTVEATNDPVGRAFFYLRVGDAYAEMEDNALESVSWYVKALNEFQKKGSDLMMYRALYNYGSQMEILGKSKEVIPLAETFKKKYPPLNVIDKQNLFLVLARAYLNIGEIEMSGKYYQEAEKLQGEVQAVSGKVNTNNIYYYIGLYYFKIKEYEKSRTYLMKVLNTKPQTLGFLALSRINLLLFTIDSTEGNLQSAIKNLREYVSLNDSVYSEKQSKQIRQWDIFYKTEKKENDLQILTKDNQVKELLLKKADFTRNIIIASAVLLLAFLFTGYSLKQRNNKKLQAQQREINGQNVLLKEYLTAQQKLLEEKEWLVKEIHHRVKNNLQMIISLLNAQTEYLQHPSALKAIKESGERMQAIALIHQKLYQPDEGTLIDMKSYISELIAYLSDSFTNPKRIKFDLNVENIQLDVSQSVPVGLILNEAITNVNKYAFGDDDSGLVIVDLRHFTDSDILLRIIDNGHGFPPDFNLAESNSLGIQLITLFAEQLEGELQFSVLNGVGISVIFKQHQINKLPYFKN